MGIKNRALWLLTLIWILWIIPGCQPDQATVTELDSTPSGPIVVTISDSPGKYRDYKSGNSGPYIPFIPAVRYITDLGVQERWDLLDPDSTYQLTISTDRSLLELGVLRRPLIEQKYYLQPGDTLTLQFDSTRLNAHLIRGDQRIPDLSDTIQRMVYAYEYAAADKLKGVFHFMELDFNQSPEENHRRVADFEKQLRTQSVRENKEVANILYQYYEAGTISKAEYLHRLNEVAFRLSGSGEELITGVPDDYRQRTSPYQLFYPERIRAEVTRLYQGKEMLRVTNGSMMDYRLILDQINEERDGLDSLTRNRVYRYALEQIIQHFSIADQEKYLAAYRQKYDDPAYLEYVRAAYQLNYDTATDDLALESLSGKQISLQEWLAMQEGLIYIDFWASWCAPCRESFPKAAEMRTIFADRPVTFLYISLDESRDKWRVAVDEEELPSGANYRVLYPRTSPWLEKNEVQAIPRYMLLNAEGKMIQSRALGPGEDAQMAIRELLESQGN